MPIRMNALKNPHAVALGKTGGLANTAAQFAARAKNGAKGGRPSKKRTPAELKKHRRKLALAARKRNRRKK